MYTPKHFKNTNTPEIQDFIRQNGFGLLITSGDKILATSIPLELDTAGNFLTGHISAANPQAKHFSADQEVLCVFQGPHAYISSSWYDHENVPTWNYIAVHVYGNLQIISGEEVLSSLKTLVDKYEQGSEHPVSVEGLSGKYLSSSLRGIVAFKIHITSVEASYKLSQNRDEKNHSNIILQLEKRGDVNSLNIALEMKKHSFKK
jgi:transcriptional regulator